MVQPHKIIFIGSSRSGLLSLLESPHFTALEVWCLSNRLTLPLESLADEKKIPLTTFAGLKDFRALVETHEASMPFFIYQLDMLVPADLTQSYSFYNVHRGNLYTNRGPNPDIWPILNGDLETALSLHKINDKVDSGVLIDAVDVPISSNDDSVSIRTKLEMHLPRLVESLHRYLEGSREGSELSSGVYRPWVTEVDFTIDLAVDGLDVIDRKIRSQRQYNGAIVFHEGIKYYVLDILEAAERKKAVNFHFILVDEFIYTFCSSHALVLKCNKIPKHPSPPVRPPSKRI